MSFDHLPKDKSLCMTIDQLVVKGDIYLADTEYLI